MSTDNVYIPKEGRLSDLRSWIAGELGASIIRLYDSNTIYNEDRICSDYTEASFVGYAPVGPVAYPAPAINGGGKARSDSPVATWNFTAGSGTAVVFGIFITDPSQTVLLEVIPFLSPFTFSPANPTLAKVLQQTMTSEL